MFSVIKKKDRILVATIKYLEIVENNKNKFDVIYMFADNYYYKNLFIYIKKLIINHKLTIFWKNIVVNIGNSLRK